MAATLVSNNTTIQNNGGIFASVNAGTATLVTARPALRYALLNISIIFTGAGQTATVSYGGNTILSRTSSAAGSELITGFVLGDGNALAATAGAGVTISVSGTEFANSP